MKFFPFIVVDISVIAIRFSCEQAGSTRLSGSSSGVAASTELQQLLQTKLTVVTLTT